MGACLGKNPSPAAKNPGPSRDPSGLHVARPLRSVPACGFWPIVEVEAQETGVGAEVVGVVEAGAVAEEGMQFKSTASNHRG